MVKSSMPSDEQKIGFIFGNHAPSPISYVKALGKFLHSYFLNVSHTHGLLWRCTDVNLVWAIKFSHLDLPQWLPSCSSHIHLSASLSPSCLLYCVQNGLFKLQILLFIVFELMISPLFLGWWTKFLSQPTRQLCLSPGALLATTQSPSQQRWPSCTCSDTQCLLAPESLKSFFSTWNIVPHVRPRIFLV